MADKNETSSESYFDTKVRRERVEGRQDMDYGAIIAIIGAIILVLSCLAALFKPEAGIIALIGLCILGYGVVRFVKGVIRVRSTRDYRL